jgi:phenylacetate-CoA ligase
LAIREVEDDLTFHLKEKTMTSERPFWNMEMETLPPEKLHDLQMQKLKKQLAYCFENSEFYKKKFDDAGAKPQDIKTWSDFRKLPVFFSNKEDERQSRLDSEEKCGHPYGMHLCAPVESLIDARTTTGTTGIPTFSYTFTKHDANLWKEALARMLWRAGVRSNDVLLYGLNLGIYAGGIIADFFRDCGVGAQLVETGVERGAEFMLNIAKATKPTVMFCTPSFAQYLIKKAPEITGKKVNALGFKKLLTTGEPGIGLPEVKKLVENAWGIRWYDALGPTTRGNSVSCDMDEFQGMHHVDPDITLWPQDLVDPITIESITVEDGAIGEGVMTDLERESCPFIRYAYGDVLQVFTKTCKCGTPGIRFKIVGRADDMLIVKGVNVYPSAIKDILAAFYPKLTGEMRIVLSEKPPRVTPPLKIKAVYSASLEEYQLKELDKEIKAKMHSSLKVTPEIEFVPEGSLETATGKSPLFEKRYES